MENPINAGDHHDDVGKPLEFITFSKQDGKALFNLDYFLGF